MTNQVLNYNTRSYLKYDHLPPEDEIKKKLEMANILRILDDYKQIKLALDIGAATGRYPMMLKTKGIETIGIDKEYDAMMYAQKKKTDSEFPFFSVSDAIELPFHQNVFDLITCMMGTFAHFNSKSQPDICKEIVRVLKPGGLFILSTWDIGKRQRKATWQ
nr:class I SAM-dependent methyltransferase [Sporomusa acidovorans]OZC22135.1 demethylmenaquinone methyltransferase [Sporomusa acidovorans DSM 3132]